MVAESEASGDLSVFLTPNLKRYVFLGPFKAFVLVAPVDAPRWSPDSVLPIKSFNLLSLSKW